MFSSNCRCASTKLTCFSPDFTLPLSQYVSLAKRSRTCAYAPDSLASYGLNAAAIEGYKLHRRKEVSGSTVSRELALLKRMFNLATDWELFRDLNPVRKVKFIKEINTGTRVVSPEEEERLLRNATPYLQDLIRFDLNTGLRIGEVFILRWSDVDFENNILNVFAPKTQKRRCVPINSDARKVLEAWALGRRNEFVLYNFETGKLFVDLKTGFAQACRKAGIEGVTWHTLRHTFAPCMAGYRLTLSLRSAGYSLPITMHMSG